MKVIVVSQMTECICDYRNVPPKITNDAGIRSAREITFNRETTFNIFSGTSQSNHMYIFINIKV